MSTRVGFMLITTQVPRYRQTRSRFCKKQDQFPYSYKPPNQIFRDSRLARAFISLEARPYRKPLRLKTHYKGVTSSFPQLFSSTTYRYTLSMTYPYRSSSTFQPVTPDLTGIDGNRRVPIVAGAEEDTVVGHIGHGFVQPKEVAVVKKEECNDHNGFPICQRRISPLPRRQRSPAYSRPTRRHSPSHHQRTYINDSPTPPLIHDGFADMQAVIAGTARGYRPAVHMAASDSLSAQPGYNTPLANYVASMIVWIWFGSTPSHSSSPSNPFTSPVVNPAQLQPTEPFSRFVSSLLQTTLVSHSVTLVALLYVYRFKMRHPINAVPGSEIRPFVASLMLANKYLDE